MSTQVTMATDVHQVPVVAFVTDDDGYAVVDVQGEVPEAAAALDRVRAALGTPYSAAAQAEAFAAYARSYGLRTSPAVTLDATTRAAAAQMVTAAIASGRAFGEPSRVSLLDRVADARRRLMMDSTGALDAAAPAEDGVAGAWTSDAEAEFLAAAGGERRADPAREADNVAFLQQWLADRRGDEAPEGTDDEPGAEADPEPVVSEDEEPTGGSDDGQA